MTFTGLKNKRVGNSLMLFIISPMNYFWTQVKMIRRRTECRQGLIDHREALLNAIESDNANLNMSQMLDVWHLMGVALFWTEN